MLHRDQSDRLFDCQGKHTYIGLQCLPCGKRDAARRKNLSRSQALRLTRSLICLGATTSIARVPALAKLPPSGAVARLLPTDQEELGQACLCICAGVWDGTLVT